MIMVSKGARLIQAFRRPRTRDRISCAKSCLLSILLIVFVPQCRASVVDITTKNLPNGTAKTYYSAVIAANGGCTPYRWAVVSGKLPPGVEGKTSTKTTSLDLSGTPTVGASHSFRVSVRDCGGHVSEASYEIVIKAAIDITTKNLPNGTAKTYYSAVIAANGGCTPYRWAVVSGKLPPGVEGKTSTKATSLDLSGTPTVGASHSFRVSVRDCGGHVSEASYEIVIKAAIDITTKNLPNGTAKTYYSAVIAANGGCTPYRWAVVSGKLPPGVEGKTSTKTTSLDLSGTPTVGASHSFRVSVRDCGGHVSEASYEIVIKAAIDITTKNLPNGTAKTYYSAVIAANGGCTPYRWAVVSGKLPPGVEGKTSTKTTSLDLSGTPTVGASHSFRVSVRDCGGHVSEASYEIVIKAAIDITTKNLPNGTAKTYYSAVIAANGGCTPYRWAVVSGKLPPGVEGKTSTKTTSLDLSGTPTVGASHSFRVSVRDCGGHVSEASYEIVIKAAIDITTKNLPNGTAKTYYSAVIAANGGCTPYRWAVVSGKLPPGVEGKTSTKTTSLDLSGTPTVGASHSFRVSVRDCGGHVSEASYEIVIKAAIDITTKNLPNGTAKTYYSAVIAANGGCTPYRWAVVSGKLPPGVEGKTSTKATSLDLSGTPTVGASHSFRVSVRDCGGHVSEASYEIVIKAAIDITTKNLPNGTAKTYYSAVIAANGGCTPYRWAVVSGKLPPGVEGKTSTKTTSLDLSGTPTVGASHSFRVSVRDCGGHVSEASYEIVIKAATSHFVDLRWDASTSNDVAGYNVYRGPDGLRWHKINDSLLVSTYYNDSTITDGSTYYYSATAVSVSGEESKKTPAIMVSIPE